MAASSSGNGNRAVNNDDLYELGPWEKQLFESSSLEDDYELGDTIGKYVLHFLSSSIYLSVQIMNRKKV